MAKYNEHVIQQFADYLYRRANGIIASWTLLFALLGIVGGLLASWVLAEAAESPADPVYIAALGAIAGCLAFGYVGFSLGRSRAFTLKLTAQTALCQAQIERNTRSSSLAT